MAPTEALPFSVLVEETGEWAEAEEADTAVLAARTLLDKARELGHRSPGANFYANGVLVRYRVPRIDLSGLGRKCWCGRGALKIVDDFGFCSDQHRALWDRLSDQVKARVSVLQFLSQYGERHA